MFILFTAARIVYTHNINIKSTANLLYQLTCKQCNWYELEQDIDIFGTHSSPAKIEQMIVELNNLL